jgi:hypothetical protein
MNFIFSLNSGISQTYPQAVFIDYAQIISVEQ